MIRIDGDTFYISAGEACYIFKIEDGVPTHTYFGKRVEPEDDLSALGCGGKIKELYAQAVIDGKIKDLDLKFVGARVEEDGSGNGRSLAVELCDEKSRLKAHMYYTPHSRGGIYRRVSIEHTDSGSVQLALVRQSVGCGYGVGDQSKDCGFFASFGVAHNGDAYGFLCAQADGDVAIKQAGGDVAAVCEAPGAITIHDFDEAECPELLCVYSDVGEGRMSRIFHDIMREDEEDANLSERAAVLFLPKTDAAKIAAAVKSASELGFGAVALDGGKHSKAALRALGEACRGNGLIAGLRINFDCIEGGSALYTNVCKTASAGVYKYEYSDKHVAALYHAARAAVAQNDIGYVLINAPQGAENSSIAHGMFAIKNMLKNEFPGLRVDFCLGDVLGKSFTVYYPTVFVRNIISPEPTENFKTRFDAASLGTLGYEFNPIELSDGIKRAVRAQILSYQDDARCILRGDIYRYGVGRMAVGKDKSRAYAVCHADGGRVRFFGLDEHNLYHVRELNKTFSGAALVHCGVELDGTGTNVFHILQVADY